MESEEVDESPGKLSSSKIAQKHKMKTHEFIDKLTNAGYLVMKDDKPSLTELGKTKGGEFKYSQRFGPYFVWPENLEF